VTINRATNRIIWMVSGIGLKAAGLKIDLARTFASEFVLEWVLLWELGLGLRLWFSWAGRFGSVRKGKKMQ
jgi:hypothetical protein